MAQVEEAPSPRDPDVAEAALLFEPALSPRGGSAEDPVFEPTRKTRENSSPSRLCSVMGTPGASPSISSESATRATVSKNSVRSRGPRHPLSSAMFSSRLRLVRAPPPRVGQVRGALRNGVDDLARASALPSARRSS